MRTRRAALCGADLVGEAMDREAPQWHCEAADRGVHRQDPDFGHVGTVAILPRCAVSSAQACSIEGLNRVAVSFTAQGRRL